MCTKLTNYADWECCCGSNGKMIGHNADRYQKVINHGSNCVCLAKPLNECAVLADMKTRSWPLDSWI